MNTCNVCNSRFVTKRAASQHKKVSGHCVCEHCGKICGTSNALENHKNDVHSHKCPQCSTAFLFKKRLKKHQKRDQHCYCGDCDQPFASSNALTSHLQSSKHSTEFRCCDCNRSFNSSKALNDHLRDKTHHRQRSESTITRAMQHDSQNSQKKIHQCSKCSRKFKSSADMQKHMTSLAHCPLSDLPCIAGPLCEQRFPSPSALLHHLESGVCPSGMNHDKIKSLVLKYDTERLITEAPKEAPDLLHQLISASRQDEPRQSAASDSGSEVMVPTPSTLSQVCRTPSEISISEWPELVSSSSNQRCVFCSRRFGSATGLQSHLSSPAHEEPFVFCPVDLAIDGKKDSKTFKAFRTVSGLAQHLESGACYGGKDGLKKAIQFVEENLKRWGLNLSLTIKNT